MTLSEFESVILAAGRGCRLGKLGEEKPKGLLTVDGETLVERSVHQLRECGTSRVVLVVGHMKHMYEAIFADDPLVKIVENPNFEATGSFDSLIRGLRETSHTVLTLDSDIIYETRGLRRLLSSSFADALLVSGLTESGDEVWVASDNGRLIELSKRLKTQGNCLGEFVGVVRLSPGLVNQLKDLHDSNPDNYVQREYEQVLDELSNSVDLGVESIESLVWGEVDTVDQLHRVRRLFENQGSSTC